MSVISRQSMFAGTAAAVMAPAVAITAAASPDAELINRCHQLAEADLANWYRYVTAPEDVADEQDEPPDFDTLHWIAATPAATPDGVHAKALAYAAWNRDAYDGDGLDSAASLLASLLRDMVAPARRAILTKLQAEYGPLSNRYDADWCFMAAAEPPTAYAELARADVPPPELSQSDTALLGWCAEFCDLERQIEAIFDAHPAPTVEIEEVVCPIRDALSEPLRRQQRRLINRICAAPATTAAGYIALAEVLALRIPKLKPDDPSKGSGDRVQDHLLRSLLGRARA